MATTILICEEMYLMQWNEHFFRGSGQKVHLIAFIGERNLHTKSSFWEKFIRNNSSDRMKNGL